MRKTIPTITTGLLASCLFASSAGAEALLGHQYFEIAGGWERVETNTSSDDGLAAEIEWNMPVMTTHPTADFGIDFLLRGELADLSGHTMREGEALVRGYMRQEGGFLPFGGIGAGILELPGPDSGYMPLEAGIEFGLDNVAVRPYARYAFTSDDEIGDFWTIGGKGVLWFHPETWGLTAKLEYSSFQEENIPASPENSLSLRIGVLFDY